MICSYYEINLLFKEDYTQYCVKNYVSGKSNQNRRIHLINATKHNRLA